MLEEKIINEIKTHEMNKAFIMMYFFDKVIIGKYQNNELIIPDSYNENLVDEIHIFNEDLEIRYSREYDEFIEIRDTRDYFEEKMYLFGNKSESVDGGTLIKQYGREIILPFQVNILNAQHNLRLVVRNLFDDNNTQICGYRLVGIIGGDI